MAQADTPESPTLPDDSFGAPAVTTVKKSREPRRPVLIGTGVYARPAKSRWQRLRTPITVFLIVCLIALGIRFIADVAGLNNTFTVHVESQQPVTIDLRSAIPRSPYVFGVNAFPSYATVSQDGHTGFMLYGADMQKSVSGMGVTMMRFPGGAWGEEHTLSLNQVDAFLKLAKQTGAQPLMQVRLSGGTAQQAAALVSYTNNPKSPLRVGRAVPAMPVTYWVIGNEPDLIGPSYTVADYVRDFIAYATAMKAVDPNIKILGPEISQYNGPTAPPADAKGTPWLDGFLRGVGQYQTAYHVRLLDGVTIHRYPFGSTLGSVGMLFTSSQEWRYLIPLLQQQIQRDLGYSLPIGVTEINTSALSGAQATPLATALWWADTLGTLIEERVAYIDFFGLQGIEEPYMLLDAKGNPTPLSRVMELYRHMEPEMVPVGGASDPVSVYASTTSDHHHLALMLINKGPASAAVDVQSQAWFSGWPATHVTVPAYGIVCVTLDDSGSGQTYLYAPTADMVAHNNPGVIDTASLP